MRVRVSARFDFEGTYTISKWQRCGSSELSRSAGRALYSASFSWRMVGTAMKPGSSRSFHAPAKNKSQLIDHFASAAAGSAHHGEQECPSSKELKCTTFFESLKMPLGCLGAETFFSFLFHPPVSWGCCTPRQKSSRREMCRMVKYDRYGSSE